MKRRGRKSAAQTPAPKKERVYGSAKNPVGSAASKTSASKIQLSDAIVKTLEKKRDDFNEKHPTKKVSLATLMAVMRRGMGAYSKSHRPTITGGAPNSRQAWGFARVNKFLKKYAGEQVKAAYVQDDDLLEKGGQLYHLGGDMSKHLAPNGKPSNLTHEQWHLVRTPEFKAWFGDWENDPENASKVVDYNGEPLVVYRGVPKSLENKYKFDFDTQLLTAYKRVNKFGFYFTSDYEFANSYAKNYAYPEQGVVISYFLNIRRLIKIKDENETQITQVELLDLLGLKNKYIQEYELSDAQVEDMNRDGSHFSQKRSIHGFFVQYKGYKKPFSSFLKKNIVKKYDGILFFENWANINSDNYVCFEPNQIKLADGTNTTFDSQNPDIRYKDGGQLYLGNVYSGSKVKTYLDKAEYKDQSFFQFINNRDRYILKSVTIQDLVSKDSTLQSFLKSDEAKYERNTDELFWINKYPIVVGDTDFGKNVVLDGYHRIAQAIANGQSKINAFVKIGSEYKDGGMTKIQLPDVESSYERLQTVLAAQGYELKQGMKPTMTVEQIAKKHNTTVGFIEQQLAIGTEHEMEHTYSKEIAENTALHHLGEDHKYYIRLKDMEMRAEAEKLEGFYKDGGALSGETTCEVLDENGERKIDKTSIENLTKCLNDLPQTKSMHFDYETNDYKPYRKRLHKDIIYHFKKDLICVERKQPIAILMGGSPASGKSTFLKKYAPYLLREEIFKVDADEIRARLPEYRGYNASQTHLETKDIVNTLLSDRNIGIPCRFDVIYDGTMNNTKSYLPLINLLKREGYKVFIVYIDKVPKDVIVKRALERYKKAGRFVPLEVIDDFFEKGTEALEQLKTQVDGYMVIDGSSTDYKIIETGGDKLPKDRKYSNIGTPIQITTDEVVREFKKGGEIDPDDPKTKQEMTHKAGAAGGLLVGNRHSEGGIKAINKSTGQPLEMEGGEVVITRNAVSDGKKREFEGEMLTNREILSRINQSGGGVAFAEGGDVPERCACSGKKYNYGGKVRTDYEIVNEINEPTREEIGFQMYAAGGSVAVKNPFGEGELKIPTLSSFIKKGQPLESNGIKYIPKLDKSMGEVVYYRNGDVRSKKMSSFDAYRFYLMQQYKLAFDRLTDAIKKTLTVK